MTESDSRARSIYLYTSVKFLFINVITTIIAYKSKLTDLVTPVDLSCISAGKVYERSKSKKPATPKWEMRSTYPLRANIWEYLYEDNVEQKFSCSNKRRHKKCKHKSVESDSCMKTAVWFLLILAVATGILG